MLALDVYLHRLVSLLGGCVADPGGPRRAGVHRRGGRARRRLRAQVAERLAWLGVAIDPSVEGEEITASGATVRTFVVESREDLQMAAEARPLL